MMQPQTIRRFHTVRLRPAVMQFVINELPLLMLCAGGWCVFLVCHRNELITALLLLLSGMALYRYAYLRRLKYHIKLAGLKTVSIYSGDRTTPRLDIIGVKANDDIVAVVRERVEYNKLRKGIYEITNR